MNSYCRKNSASIPCFVLNKRHDCIALANQVLDTCPLNSLWFPRERASIAIHYAPPNVGGNANQDGNANQNVIWNSAYQVLFPYATLIYHPKGQNMAPYNLEMSENDIFTLKKNI